MGKRKHFFDIWKKYLYVIQDTLESTFQARVSADFSQTQKGHCLSFHLQVYYHRKYSIEEKIELMALVDCHLSWVDKRLAAKCDFRDVSWVQKYWRGNMSLLCILMFLATSRPILTLAKKGDFRFSRVPVHEKTFQLEWKGSPSRLEHLLALVRRRLQRWESAMASIIVAKLKTLTILETTESLDRLMSMRVLFCQHARRFKKQGEK